MQKTTIYTLEYMITEIFKMDRYILRIPVLLFVPLNGSQGRLLVLFQTQMVCFLHHSVFVTAPEPIYFQQTGSQCLRAAKSCHRSRFYWFVYVHGCFEGTFCQSYTNVSRTFFALFFPSHSTPAVRCKH